ncbi:GAF domain-containing protein [Fulvivirga ligni]|uniref:GAF domain-containing protein n=1 Tax=Fulvivirga ligni TaxID=2904246 RepID=UPI001F3F4BEF|nr:GAF domain-containing protein [Fulvivirga ligni]UII21310.1 GAF domain-containing protein [Fulvivirga ligni]
MTNSVKYAITLGAISIMLSALIIYVERNMYSTNIKNQPYIALGEYLKNVSTKAHLWFEEAMSGDESIDVNRDVYDLLQKSITTLEAVIEGGETEVGTFTQTSDSESIKIINKSIEDIKRLKLSAEERWRFKTLDASSSTSEGEEAGGALDQKFDAAYEDLQNTYDRLTNHVKGVVKQDNEFLNILSWTSIVSMLIVFILSCFLLYKIQHKSEVLTADNARKLNEETTKIAAFSSFVQSIAEGNYDSHLEIKDELGAKLIDMRDRLSENSKNETQRSWSSTGLAQMGDILRTDYSKLSDLYDNILKFVIEYTHSNQGSLFLINDENNRNDQYLELVASYAYDRKKFLEKKVDIGVGLVGQSFLEGKTTYLLDFPENYINITSGLGKAPPNAIIIVPLKINEETYGILEMASFRKYEPHEIDLIEKFSESIASTVATVRTNQQTKILLEQTRQQTEEMRSQEEEMRQNMEELNSTQEEMSRKEKEYISRIAELEKQLNSKLV